MRYFFRSARYVLTYRLRLAGLLFCVVMISLLWAAGLGVLLPAMKVLISDEGLHGWADRGLVAHRLKIDVIRREIDDPNMRIRLGGISDVVSIYRIRTTRKAATTSPLAAEPIDPDAWIVGVDGEHLDYQGVLQRLALMDAGQDWNLDILNPGSDAVVSIRVTPLPATAGVATRVHRLVELMPRPQDQADRFTQLVIILLIGLGLTYARNAFRFLQTYLVQTTVHRAIMDIRCVNYGVAIRLPLIHYALRGASDTMSRFVADCQEITKGLVFLLGKSLVEPAKLIGAFSLALVLNWKLTLLACIVGPPTFVLIRKLGKKIRKASKRALEGQATLLQSLEETLTGLRVVKAYTTEEIECKRFRGITNRIYKQLKRVAAADAATAPIVEAMGLTAALAAIGLAGYWVIQPGRGHTGLAGWLLDNEMDAETFMTVIGTLAAMFDPVRRLSQISVAFYNADAAAQRVFELQDEATETDLKDAQDLPRHHEDIEFRDVSYTYTRASRPAVSDITLKIWQGESVAFVGGNGSGKTTLLSLLPRFFHPQKGKILIDGVDIAEVKLLSLRKQIGLVTQDAVIFNASVADNIAYGAPHVTRDEIVAAGRQSFADDFVTQMPEGYDTVIGEHGSTLSGGQRQRIAIARAILRDPAILILDEAMSQIDSESEAKINLALKTFMAGRTTLLIAHRFSTVISADTVVVLHDGRLIDAGKHEELVRRCDVYRTLFETQLIGDQ